MNQLLQIESHFEESARIIASLREKKNRFKETLKLLNAILERTYDMVVNLLLEKHLLYQHEVMQEEAKPGTKRKTNQCGQYLRAMVQSAQEAEAFIKINNLKRWTSRVARCLGRAYDYQGQYQAAINQYQIAIKNSKKDPEYIREGVPRWLEYQAFLAFSIIMSGQNKKGLALAKKTYTVFKTDKKAVLLRKNDYPTWAIWITGIPIRVAKAMVEGKLKVDKNEIVRWLDEASVLINQPATSGKWLGKVDFGFRREEIATLRRRI